MTLEGRKPLVENSDEVSWSAAAFSNYAEMGRDQHRAERLVVPLRLLTL